MYLNVVKYLGSIFMMASVMWAPQALAQNKDNSAPQNPYCTRPDVLRLNTPPGGLMVPETFEHMKDVIASAPCPLHMDGVSSASRAIDVIYIDSLLSTLPTTNFATDHNVSPQEVLTLRKEIATILPRLQTEAEKHALSATAEDNARIIFLGMQLIFALNFDTPEPLYYNGLLDINLNKKDVSIFLKYKGYVFNDPAIYDLYPHR